MTPESLLEAAYVRTKWSIIVTAIAIVFLLLAIYLFWQSGVFAGGVSLVMDSGIVVWGLICSAIAAMMLIAAAILTAEEITLSRMAQVLASATWKD